MSPKFYLFFFFAAIVSLFSSENRAGAYPGPNCVYYAPTWSVYSSPDIDGGLYLPEPGLTNESMVVAGGVTGHDGTLQQTEASDNCQPRIQTLSWPQYASISWGFYWALSATPPVLALPNSFSNSESGSFSISFIPHDAGDQKLVVAIKGVATLHLTNFTYASLYPVIVPISVFPRQRLAYLSFNNGTLEGDLGQLPVTANNISRVFSPFGHGINFDASSIELKYPAYQNDTFSVVEADSSIAYSTGSPNIRLNAGTARFWFKPNWSSGSGPSGGVAFQILTSGGSPLRTVQITGSGSTIQIDSVSFPIHLISGQWYQIAATYSSGNTFIYTNGVQAGSTGSGVSGSSVNFSSNFRVGSDGGSGQVRGIMDEIETFNYVKPSSEILSDYQAACAIDADGDGIPDLAEFQMGIDPSDPPGGSIPSAPPATNPGDMTPPVIHLLEPINAIPY